MKKAENRWILVNWISQVQWFCSLLKRCGDRKKVDVKKKSDEGKGFECDKIAATEKGDATVALIPDAKSKEEVKAYTMVELILDKAGVIKISGKGDECEEKTVARKEYISVNIIKASDNADESVDKPRRNQKRKWRTSIQV